MIKIFASDMDHTLLDNDSQLPQEIGSIIDSINDNDQLFIAASGRTLSNLEHKFGELQHKISFIADNGATLKHKGKLLYVNTMKKEAVIDTINKLRYAKNSTIVVMTPEMAYVEQDLPGHQEFLAEYYTNLTQVDNLMDYTKDIIKITTLSPDLSHQNFLEFVDGKLDDSIYGVESGKVWIDIMNKNVNKAQALQYIMDLYDINTNEVAAFGDYFNDLEMIKLVKYGYAVNNAPDGVKKHAYEVIGNNYDNAVINKIKEHIEKK